MKQKWIPCSDRLPSKEEGKDIYFTIHKLPFTDDDGYEYPERYLVVIGDFQLKTNGLHEKVGYWSWRDQFWDNCISQRNSDYGYEKVIAWMPHVMPEPYKEEENEQTN